LPQKFYLRVETGSKTPVDGQYAVLPGGTELLAFTAGKAGASQFFLADTSVLVEAQSGAMANTEEIGSASSFFMNGVDEMVDVNAVPVVCSNRSGKLFCTAGDRDQLWYCNVYGTTALVIAPSDYDNGFCRAVTLDIIAK
jgi:hypothetical protein